MDAEAARVARVGADDDAFAELSEHLAASAARAERGARGDDRDGPEFLVAIADRLENSGALGADCQAVAGVFDVDAGVNLA